MLGLDHSGWSGYARIALSVWLFVWLLALTWWVYNAVSSLRKRHDRIRADMKVLNDAIVALNNSVNGQERTLEVAKRLTDETLAKLSSQGQALSSLKDHLHEQNQKSHEFQSQQSFDLAHSDLQRSADSLMFRESASIPSSHPLVHPLDPAAAIAVEFQEAFYRGDRSALRRMTSEEMNITQDSEDALVRRTASATTQLQVVKGGGSYLLIRQQDRSWLIPTFQTLNSFMTSQPAKGIFAYERQPVSGAELRRPAEVRDLGGVWEVVSMGVVAVPA